MIRKSDTVENVTYICVDLRGVNSNENNVSHVDISNSNANINSLHGNIFELYKHIYELYISFIANLTFICLFGHRNPSISATRVFYFLISPFWK